MTKQALPYHLIITVGTSLLGNLKRAGVAADSAADLPAMLAQVLQWDPAQREAGAELNSSMQLLQQGKIHPQASLHLCVSDTPSGQWVGQLLQAVFEQRDYQVSLKTIEGLQDSDPVRFSNQGLRNLVRLCGEIIQAAGGSQFVALNATGGYKAQIAVAALVGSALQIPVYYKHEMFDQIIGFPPLPVSLDDQLVKRNLAYLEAIENTESQNAPAEPALLALIDQVEIEGQPLYALSPMGQICLTAYRQRHPAPLVLPPAAAAKDRKDPSFRDDHYPKGFHDFVNKIWRESAYITHCSSKSYDKQKGIRHGHFYIQPHDPELIIGEYLDANQFGSRFRILTTATSPAERQAILQDLRQRYGPEA